MKKAIFYLLACVLLPVAASADEGMWLVSTFRDVIYPQMKKEGLKLKPGEIYNEESRRCATPSWPSTAAWARAA